MGELVANHHRNFLTIGVKSYVTGASNQHIALSVGKHFTYVQQTAAKFSRRVREVTINVDQFREINIAKSRKLNCSKRKTSS